MGTIAGDKFTKSHTTVLDSTVRFLEHLARRKEIKKIALGKITPMKPISQPRVKAKPIPAGWLLTMRANAAVQEVYVYTVDAPATEEAVFALWKEWV